MVGAGKVSKDRLAPHPAIVRAGPARHLATVKAWHDLDLRYGAR